MTLVDPQKEYNSRLVHWSRVAEHLEMRHRRTGYMRLAFGVALLVTAGALLPWIPIGFLLAGVFSGMFISGMFHDRIIEERDRARQLVGFYQRGLERLDARWMGKGSGGSEYLNPQHPYAIDLDVFGPGSLFEFVNSTQTAAGRASLAQWLLAGGEKDEIAARQAAVEELRSRFDLREALAMRTVDHTTHIRTDALLAWAARPLATTSVPVRVAGMTLTAAAWTFLLLGQYPICVAAAAVQGLFALASKRRTSAAFASMNLRARELRWLSDLLTLFEKERLQSPRLRELQSKWKRENIPASVSLRRLARLAEWMDSYGNDIFKLVGGAFLLKTHFGFALASWHARHGAMLNDWLAALGEMEALSSLAGYAGEHPEDVFPELVFDSAAALISAQGLAHPLIAESQAVRNDLLLDANQPLHLISGSNMSGKSTWLRAIAANLVLAMAGAPVRAFSLRMTRLQIGASIRTTDSLQEGISRFYAEIKRLRQLVQMTEQSDRLLFLIDEILSGTNSHDRQIGAAFIAKALVERNGVGLLTTHDLALTNIVGKMGCSGANFHFEDQLIDGKLSFDYRLRPGAVTKSNALDLMRSIGLDVQKL